MADEKRPPGRPKAEEPSTRVSFWAPVREYDRLVKLAHQRDQSLSALVRELLKSKRDRVIE